MRIHSSTRIKALEGGGRSPLDPLLGLPYTFLLSISYTIHFSFIIFHFERRGKFVQFGRNVALVYALIVGLMSMDELVVLLSMDELHLGRDAPAEK